MIFDTHTHYDDARFEGEREEIIASLKKAGIGGLVAVGADLESSRRSVALAERYPFIRAAVGVHPHDIEEAEALGEEGFRAELEALANHSAVRAVGEIGLDYHWEEPDRLLQQKWFRFQLDFLREKKLPGVIHSRDAAADTLGLIRDAGGQALSLDIHCFSYEKEMARLYLDMGHYLGIGGVVTYKNGRKLKEVVQYMPLERILLETDCPYLAPEPYRGKRNDSRLLPFVVREIARLKNTDEEEVEAVCLENALRFFRLCKEDFV